MKRFYASLLLVAFLACGNTAGAQEMPRVTSGFTIAKIAQVPEARELAIAPNGDLFVGTSGSAVYIVADADSKPSPAQVFVRLHDSPVAGVAFDGNTMYLGSQFGIWRLPYTPGDRTARAAPRKIASVRTSGVARDHVTTTLAVAGGKVYASVGSSCDNCQPELDATRATIQVMNPDGSHMRASAVHVRNAIALTVNPVTGTVWAGVAGQDALEHGHPYEIFDSVTLHEGTADYGWPFCYENRRTALAGHDCSSAVVPRVVFPAYETPIGAVFYPENLKGREVFPRTYWGGAFVTLHGSWHTPPVSPRVAFIPMHRDSPARAVNWSNPDMQWTEFLGGFQQSDGSRFARPTGLAVGPQGDLFVAEDSGGAIYRIRPTH